MHQACYINSHVVDHNDLVKTSSNLLLELTNIVVMSIKSFIKRSDNLSLYVQPPPEILDLKKYGGRLGYKK